MDEEEESYATGLSHILRDARGPLTDLEDFDQHTPDPVVSVQNEPVASIGGGDSSRLMRMRTAALIAVLSATGARPASRSKTGRRLGSAWSRDHRRRRMGMSGLASHRNQRARWR